MINTNNEFEYPGFEDLKNKEKLKFIYELGLYGEYEEVFETILKNYLSSENKEEQIFSMRAISNLIYRYKSVKQEVLPLLFQRLENKDSDIKHNALDTLHIVAFTIPRLRQEVLSTFHSIKNKFFTDKEKQNYILYLGYHGDYKYTQDYLSKYHLNDTNISLQITAMQAIELIAVRFGEIDESLILPILFEKLSSFDNDIKYVAIDTLRVIKNYVPRIEKQIYFGFIENKIDIFSWNTVPVFPHKLIPKSLSQKEKAEAIISTCMYDPEYLSAFKVCKKALKENSEDLHLAALNGLTYIIIRFGKINFEEILPLIMNCLSSEDSIEYSYAESLLYKITIVVPELKTKANEVLKNIGSAFYKP